MSVKHGTEIATIDVVLVTFEPYDIGADELAITTANSISVTIATETVDKVPLISKGRLIAQKPQTVTVTGNTIVLTDNVFTPELVLILQGGTIKYDSTDPNKIVGYTPPAVGSNEKGKIFRTRAYSANYDSAGIILGYERMTYPNCQGTPISFSSSDGVFRVAEYTINSAPAQGEAPYDMDIVPDLPKVL